MNITAATVTVYFVGLIHFYNVQPAGERTAGSGDVYVPQATSTKAMHGLTLAPHRAYVVVNGFDSTRGSCTGLGGTPGSTASECTFENVTAATEVALPITAATPELRIGEGFRTVPKLEETCPPERAASIGPMRPAIAGGDYAIHVSLSRGALDACTPKVPWVSFLAIENAANTFSLGGTNVPLVMADTTSIEIRSEPRQHDPDTSDVVQKSHYWWYYTMYVNAGACDGLPSSATSAACPPDFELSRAHPYATGIGCSNTQYP